jgi:hypothetical protein
MKKLLIILVTAASVWFTVNSCKKTGGSVNPLTDVKNNTIGSYLVLDSSISLTFGSPIASSTVGIITHGYPGGEAVDHTILYAAKGSTYDTTQWHMVKSVPYTSGGNKLTVTGAELGTAFGVDPSTFAPGTFYTVYTRVVTKSGKTYDVNNTGNNSGSGLVTGPFYYSAFSFTAYVGCAFVSPIAGTYKVVYDDDWQDNKDGDLVQVTDGPGANQVNLSQVWPGVNSGGIVVKPLVVNVNPANGVATVPKVDFATYNGTLASAASGTGYVLSCTGYITLSIDLIYGGSDQGNLKLVLQKQ